MRLSGTNSDKGKEILSEYAKKNSSFKFLTVDNLNDAAKKAVLTLKNWYKNKYLISIYINILFQ